MKNLDETPNTVTDGCDGNSYLYIWKTLAPKSVGHVAIQVGGCEPKVDANKKGNYISIHPGLVPSMGPLVVCPMPAALSVTLCEDMEIEASYQKSTLDPDDPSSVFQGHHVQPKTLAPDYIFKFSNLNTSAMRMFIHNVKKEVETGQSTYQLFPKMNALRFFKDIPHALTYDPIDFKNAPSLLPSKQDYGANTYNCATLVTRILQEGGMNIKQENTPWGQSPNSLAEQLLEQDIEYTRPSFK
ncbi:MAG: hypothetical protein ACO1N3_01525 [Gammaproteobacteria bacterium]